MTNRLIISLLVSVSFFSLAQENSADVIQVASENNAKTMLLKLQSAFGGKAALKNIQTFSTHLEITHQNNSSELRFDFMHFGAQHLAQYSYATREVYFASPTKLEKYKDNRLVIAEANTQQRLINNMHVNFLYLLHSDNVSLDGPFEAPMQSKLTWWKISLPKTTSPLLGIDPVSGQIRKVYYPSGAYVEESHYAPIGKGIIWPHKFTVFVNGKQTMSGHFTESKINDEAVLPSHSHIEQLIPNWFGKVH